VDQRRARCRTERDDALRPAVLDRDRVDAGLHLGARAGQAVSTARMNSLRTIGARSRRRRRSRRRIRSTWPRSGRRRRRARRPTCRPARSNRRR
jgi:hypothetical protein